MPTEPEHGQAITIRRGEDAVISFVPKTTVDITGWALAFNLATAPGQAVLGGFPLTIGSGITVTDAAAGEYTVTISKALSVGLTAGKAYHWDVWRTDVATEWPLASGTLSVKEPVRRPA